MRGVKSDALVSAHIGCGLHHRDLVGGSAIAGRVPLTTDSLESVVVRFGELETTILTGGELIPIKQTEVTCDVEDVTDSDGTMILTVVENGAARQEG